MSRFVLIGPGRAGMSVALAARRAGHQAVGVLGRATAAEAGSRLECPVLAWHEPLPAADLTILAVRDDAIAEIADRVIPPQEGMIVHLSGLTGIGALAPLTVAGARPGSFHPLQTLPDPDRGAAALSGSAIAITASSDEVADELARFARSLGAEPFRLADDRKALYHAGAAAASNYVVTVLALAHDLLSAANVDPAVARSLVSAVVENVFEIGPRSALTGPIARGDVGTVMAQRRAVAGLSAELEDRFVTLGRMTARLASTDQLMAGALGLDD